MDLTERRGNDARHPWELQRFRAYRQVLADHDALDARSVLDVGAGDGWFSDSLAAHLPADATITCWDVNYDDGDLEPQRPGVERIRERPAARHDLVLVLDVLEHIADADGFVRDDLVRATRPGATALVAVPAHQRLFGAHDVALGHHRRYSSAALLEQIDPWLDVTEHGTLFTSLLVPRAAAVAAERARRTGPDQPDVDQPDVDDPDVDHGVGDWTRGRAVTTAVNAALAADVRVERGLRRVGVRLPGLSVWAIGVVR